MSVRVEIDPERLASASRRRCAKRENGDFADIQIVHLHVDMHLLGHQLPGPLRRRVVFDALEREDGARTVASDEFCPVRVVAHRLHPEQFAVEGGKTVRFGAVDYDNVESSNHFFTVRPSYDLG
jgi:hypothetical protein